MFGEAPDGQPERQPEHAIRKGDGHERFTKPPREVGRRPVGRAKDMMEPLMWGRVHEAVCKEHEGGQGQVAAQHQPVAVQIRR